MSQASFGVAGLRPSPPRCLDDQFNINTLSRLLITSLNNVKFWKIKYT